MKKLLFILLILFVWFVSFWYCQEMSFEDCQYTYWLMPIDWIDTEYCMSQDLCPAVDINYCVENQLCPACELTWWNSELIINDIQHISAPSITINIPEEFNWDYTWNDEEFIINISWYNVDTEYISSIITTQNSKPNNIDFNNIVSWLIPLLVPWLVLIAFIYFVFRFVKKYFKMSVSEVSAIFNVLSPILNWVSPIAMMSIALYFIRSFFD